MRRLVVLGVLVALGAGTLGGIPAARDGSDGSAPGPPAATATVTWGTHDVSAPLRSMSAAPSVSRERRGEGGGDRPDPGTGGGETEPQRPVYPDRRPPLAATVKPRTAAPAAPTQATPASSTSFDGVSNAQNPPGSTTVTPPDTDGAVGPNDYVQIVNLSIAVYSRTGALRPGFPAATNSLWSLFASGPACQNNNDGDPIVLYDRLADRWFVSQFALPNYPAGPFYQCIAVSQTGDPTGAYNRYQFLFSNTLLNDYPKFGIWPDAYYASVNQFNGNTFAGPGILAYERTAMLAGGNARQLYFNLGATNPNSGSLLPSDLDGSTLPPAGAANTYAELATPELGNRSLGATTGLNLWQVQASWAGTGNLNVSPSPTFVQTNAYALMVCGAGSSICIPQPGTPQKVDSLGDRLMFRLAYRNFGSHESLVLNHTVNDGGATPHAAIHWLEIQGPRSATPTVAQQGTWSPDTDHRFVGSIAMDAAGDIGLGYSVSGSTTTFPSVRYTGRVPGDPAGTLEAEVSLVAGGGSQTSTVGRWGDYSAMTIDPTDDCTFWYTQEYYAITSTTGWRTRVGSFRFSDVQITETGPASAAAGTDLTYTITPKNNGCVTAHNITVTEPIPANTTFGSATGPTPGSCPAPVGGTLTCSLGTLTSGASATVTLVLHTDAATAGGTVVTSTPSVSATEPDSAPGNNTASVSTTLTTSADLSVTKTGPATVVDGADLTYTIGVGNAGPGTAGGVTLADALPATEVFRSLSAAAGWACSTPAVGANGTVSCTKASVPNPASDTFTLVVRPTAATPSPVTNTATVAANSSSTDPNATNNSYSASTTVTPAADLSITKTASPNPVAPGATLTYTLTVTNNGPDAASSVSVSDTLPANTTFQSASGNGWNCIGTTTVSCTRTSLTAGATAPAITIAVTVAAGATGSIANTASVSATTQDPIGANNSSTATVTVSTPPPPPPPPPPPGGGGGTTTTTSTTAPSGTATRLAGSDREGTAIRLSQDTFATVAGFQGQVRRFQAASAHAGAVVVARSDQFPDALAGTPLAVARTAPLLLTSPGQLDPPVETEIRRVLASGGTVYLLGGPSALSTSIDARLQSLGYTAQRLAGADRFATAVAIAGALGDPATVLLATGTDFPDALAGGAAAARLGAAVLLTAGSSMPQATSSYLAAHPGDQLFALGGPAAAAAPSATGLVGADRYQTAVLVARRFFSSPSVVGVASGAAFPDALSGGTHAGLHGGPLLLTQPGAVPDPLAQYLADNKMSLTQAYVYGGPVAIADSVVATIQADIAH